LSKSKNGAIFGNTASKEIGFRNTMLSQCAVHAEPMLTLEIFTSAHPNISLSRLSSSVSGTRHLTLPRKKHLVESGEVKQAFDLMAALQWSQFVSDEGGDNYASTVKWCFTSASNENKSWRGDIIRNVIRQLELYQDKEHFEMAAVT
jgi:hypothetical protein